MSKAHRETWQPPLTGFMRQWAAPMGNHGTVKRKRSPVLIDLDGENWSRDLKHDGTKANISFRSCYTRLTWTSGPGGALAHRSGGIACGRSARGAGSFSPGSGWPQTSPWWALRRQGASDRSDLWSRLLPPPACQSEWRQHPWTNLTVKGNESITANGSTEKNMAVPVFPTAFLFYKFSLWPGTISLLFGL